MNALTILPATPLTDNAGAIASADKGPRPATSLVYSPANHALAKTALPDFLPAPTQPIDNVAEYLKTRRPVAHYSQEHRLWIKLPQVVADEVAALLEAFELVLAFTNPKGAALSVQKACARVLHVKRSTWKLKTFRRKFDDWFKAKDWFVLVNCSKAGGEFQERDCGLSDKFLNHVAWVFAEFGRKDGKRQALLSIERHWRTGRDHRGKAYPIPGYVEGWDQRITALLPSGWHESNIRRQIIERQKFRRAVQAMLHEGEAAAKEFQPQVNGTRVFLRFLEEITFDDLRFDYYIFNRLTGQAEELWALIARDTATGMVLGGVLYPATERADGKVSHLGAKQMKELAGQLLETFPLPPYLVKWKVERGTATIQEAVRAALAEMFGHRILVSYTSMIGDRMEGGWRNDKRPLGYKEKAKGNSRGKASHESHNRLFHTMGSFIPGQMGSNYDLRPADLTARIKECREIWEREQLLPAPQRGQARYPLLGLDEARAMFREFCLWQNFRTDHAMEGFEEVLEWFNPADGQLHHKDTAPNPLPPGAKWAPIRMEMPVERAKRLIRQVDGWERCSPRVVIAFLEFTQRKVVVEDNGEITFDHEGKTFRFVHGGVALPAGEKCLAHFIPSDPGYVHLTNGKGAVLGTWMRKGKVRMGDREGIADAVRYAQAAQEAARIEACHLRAPAREGLEELRAHNAAIHQFVQVTDAPPTSPGLITTPVGEALTTVSNLAKADVKKASQKATAEEREASQAAASDLLNVFKSISKSKSE